MDSHSASHLGLRQFLALGALSLAAAVMSGADTPERPNIVLIYMDDLGYGDIGSNGAVGYQTPQLDRLAAEGVRFTSFNVVHPVCSASRAALLTGSYANRVGISMALLPGSDLGLNPNEETMPELLRASGYRTALVGKWHLGDSSEAMPLRHGFDEFHGLPYSNDMWRRDYAGAPLDPEKDRNNMRINWPDTIPVIEGDQIVAEVRNMEEMSGLTARFTERAVRFIGENRDRPFFLCLTHPMPHFPIAASARFRGRSELGLFGDVMMEIDWSVGEILRALETSGLARNTLVIFTSDNGPETLFGTHGGSAGGLRGSKVTTWEGGHRVPFLARWPGRIPAGTVCNQLAANIDLLPTFAEFVGHPLPALKIDGVSIAKLLRGDFSKPARETLYYYFRDNNLDAVRRGPWKLVFPHQEREVVEPGVGGYAGEARRVAVPAALYDLRRDPGEALDVKEMNPIIVADLERVAAQARRELGDNLTNAKGEEVRPAGRSVRKEIIP